MKSAAKQFEHHPRVVGSLSVDLDNRWAYMRTHGIAGWEQHPTYLPIVCQRIEDLLSELDLTATLFVVGKDLEEPSNREAVASLAEAGHEIGNHSYWHYPWLDQLEPHVLHQEIVDTELAIEGLTGTKPRGFRAPGFSGSADVHDILAERGYLYDASTFPTLIGPLAAWYARVKSFGRRDDNAQRFATLKQGFANLRPHVITTPHGALVEVPVTTMPVFRVPIHVTYLMYLHQFSTHVAYAYLRTALRLCRLRGIAPSMLLHPLDFLGGEEEPILAFFPGMKVSWRDKLALLRVLLERMTRAFEIGTVEQHAATCLRSPVLHANTASLQTVDLADL